MKINYSVTKRDYLESLNYLLKKSDNMPLRKMLFLFATIGQLLTVIIICLLKIVQNDLMMFLLIWSPLMAGVSVLYRVLRGFRAKNMLARIQSTGEFTQDYWKIHKFIIKNNAMQLSYGSIKLECPCKYLTETVELTNVLLLFSGDNLFEIIPKRALPNITTNDFISIIHKSANDLDDEGLNDFIQSLPNDAKYALEFKTNKKQFIQSQVYAIQINHFYCNIKKPVEITRFVLSMWLIYYMIYKADFLWFLVCTLILIIANIKNIRVFLPDIKKKVIERIPELREWEELRNNRIIIDYSNLSIYNERHYMKIPLTDIEKTYCTINSIYLYINDSRINALRIPKYAIGGAKEQKEFRTFLQVRSNLNRNH